jgi:hypothetical protein
MEDPIYREQFTHNETDIAICIADYLAPLMNRVDAGGHECWSRIIENIGFGDMRDQMMRMAVVIEAIHTEARRIEDDYNDSIAFDYEIVPYLVERFRDGTDLTIQCDETFIHDTAVVMLTKLRLTGRLTD